MPNIVAQNNFTGQICKKVFHRFSFAIHRNRIDALPFLREPLLMLLQ